MLKAKVFLAHLCYFEVAIFTMTSDDVGPSAAQCLSEYRAFSTADM